jgi:hypothetical protein
MGKVRVGLVMLGLFVIAFGAGRVWKLKPETAEAHVVRKGETAALVVPGGGPVWVSRNKEDAYPFQVAMTKGDFAFLEEAYAKGSVFPVPSGTQVQVVQASVDKRQIKVLEGEHTGKTGWVEFELLRPLKRGER